MEQENEVRLKRSFRKALSGSTVSFREKMDFIKTIFPNLFAGKTNEIISGTNSDKPAMLLIFIVLRIAWEHVSLNVV